MHSSKIQGSFCGYECRTVSELGLAGKRNGELLTLAQKMAFQVFLTVDRGIERQHTIHSGAIAVVVIRSKSNRLADLLVHIPDLLQVLESIEPGQLIRMSLIK